MSDSCGLRKRNVSEGFQHLASMSDSEFEAEFRKFLAKNNKPDISLPSIDKAAIGKMDGGRRRKMKGGDCSNAMMLAIVLAVGAAIGTGGYLLHCLAGAEMASLGSVMTKTTEMYIKGLIQAGKGTLLLGNTAIIVEAYKNLAVLRSLITDSWRVVVPMSVSTKNALVELCNKLSPAHEHQDGGARRRRTYKKRSGARRGGSRCGMSGGKKRKSRRGRKSRGRKSRGRKSRGRKSRGRKSRGRKSRGRKH